MIRYPLRLGHPGKVDRDYHILDRGGRRLDELGTHDERTAQAIVDFINAAYREIPE